MSDLLNYRESIERAVRVGIVYPKKDEQQAIEIAIRQRVNWNCSDCILRAYKRANTLLQKELAQAAEVAKETEAEEKPKKKSKPRSEMKKQPCRYKSISNDTEGETTAD